MSKTFLSNMDQRATLDGCVIVNELHTHARARERPTDRETAESLKPNRVCFFVDHTRETNRRRVE